MHTRNAENMADACGGKMGFQFGFHGVVVAEEHRGDDGILIALKPILGEECGEVLLDFGGGRTEGMNGAMGKVMPLVIIGIRSEEN